MNIEIFQKDFVGFTSLKLISLTLLLKMRKVNPKYAFSQNTIAYVLASLEPFPLEYCFFDCLNLSAVSLQCCSSMFILSTDNIHM